jgi:predicted dinucleotide-binding enzyme
MRILSWRPIGAEERNSATDTGTASSADTIDCIEVHPGCLAAGLISAELLLRARIVGAFNAVGAARMATAQEQPGRIGMPIAATGA